jgi:hypothetical protein
MEANAKSRRNMMNKGTFVQSTQAVSHTRQTHNRPIPPRETIKGVGIGVDDASMRKFHNCPTDRGVVRSHCYAKISG